MYIEKCLYVRHLPCGRSSYWSSQITKFTSHLLSAYGKVYCRALLLLLLLYLLFLLFSFHLFFNWFFTLYMPWRNTHTRTHTWTLQSALLFACECLLDDLSNSSKTAAQDWLYKWANPRFMTIKKYAFFFDKRYSWYHRTGAMFSYSLFLYIHWQMFVNSSGLSEFC